MGRNARLKRERRVRAGVSLPACSYQKCASGRPPGTHLLMTKDGSGNYYAACEDCVTPMMAALKLARIDTQVITYSAMRSLSAAARMKERLGISSRGQAAPALEQNIPNPERPITSEPPPGNIST